MATQIDTGLGWSADSGWLMASAGIFASKSIFGGPDFPGQPIPKLATAADVYNDGFVVATYVTSAAHTIKVGNQSTDYDALVFLRTSPTYDLVFVAQAPVTITLININENTGTYSTTTVYVNGYDATSGLYYAGNQAFYSAWNPTLYVSTFSTMDEGLAAVQIVQLPYHKLNSGYAVECVAQWYTPEGTELIAPVLISTNPEYTVISTDGTTPDPSLTTFHFLYQGAWFYMSLIGGNSDPIQTQFAYADLRQFAAAAPSKVFQLIASSSFSNITVTDAPDPYEENAEEEGGDGDDPEDDPVEEQTNPLPSVAGLGFCTVYVPSQSELLAMSSYLWSGSFDVNQVIKLFSNPLDSILGLSAVPVDLVGTSEQIYLGGVALTGVTMPRYTGRTAVKVDMGTVTISERYGAYLDYDPYTEFAIYVPFVGIKNLKADDIMGKTLSLMYDIDILTGACVAYLRPAGGSVLYEWAGQCAQQIPVTSSNWDNIFRNAMTAATTLGTSLLAPASAPVLAGAVASAATQAIAAKPRVDRSGALTGVSGWLGQLRPYIIRTIPEAYIPADQNKFIGYPAYITVSMGTISGYNEVASVHLEGIPATGNELAEIESLLKGGVIF